MKIKKFRMRKVNSYQNLFFRFHLSLKSNITIIKRTRFEIIMVNSAKRRISGFWSISGPIMNGKNVSKNSELNINRELIVSDNFKCFSVKLKYEVNKEE